MIWEAPEWHGSGDWDRVDPHDVTFALTREGAAILCLVCGLESHNPNDVEHRYCGDCHRFHEEEAVNRRLIHHTQGAEP